MQNDPSGSVVTAVEFTVRWPGAVTLLTDVAGRPGCRPHRRVTCGLRVQDGQGAQDRGRGGHRGAHDDGTARRHHGPVARVSSSRLPASRAVVADWSHTSLVAPELKTQKSPEPSVATVTNADDDWATEKLAAEVSGIGWSQGQARRCPAATGLTAVKLPITVDRGDDVWMRVVVPAATTEGSGGSGGSGGMTS